MIRIATGHLIGMLADLVHTSAKLAESGAVAGVVLHSARGYLGDSPGKSTLLVGTSTTGRAIGHTYSHCTGELPPMLWPISEVQAVLAVCRPLLRTNKEHALQVERTGDVVTVSEDPDLFGGGLSLTFEVGDLEEYPASVWQLLADIRTVPGTDQAGVPAPPVAPRTDIQPSELEPFLRVAKLRGSVLEIYRYHQHLPLQIQIGPHYRGLLKPDRWEGDRDAGTMPGGDVYFLELAAAR